MEVLTLALIVVVLTLWLLWRKRKFSLFKGLNIPGPEPNLIFGNYWDLLQEGQHECISKWINEYGRVFGYYYGLRPVLVIADLELMRTVQLKEFHKFPNRPRLFEVGRSTTDFNEYAMTTARDKKWKNIRTVITPTFTTAKLKMMSAIVKDSINELYNAVVKEAEAGKPFNIYNLYQNLTMDVIARTSLGVHTNAQTNKNEPIIKLARLIFSFGMSYFQMLAFSFTEFISIFSLIRRILMSLYNQGKHPRSELLERTDAAIKLRRRDPNSRRRDVLQLMMDAQGTEENVNDSSLTAGENDDNIAGTTKQGTSKVIVKLTDEEILQNSVLFLLAGYETTSTALAFVTHCLVHYPDIQDKVREEIKSNITDSDDISYELANKLQYLDRVINESLRLYTPVTFFVNREAIEDTIIDGLHIPKGVAVQIPVRYLHRDPTIWEDPEKFDPNRFSPEERANRHPLAFQPFGAGPRNCIGMRFAQMEIKMALAKLLYSYKFLPKPGNTRENFEIYHAVAIDRPKSGVIIQAVKA